MKREIRLDAWRQWHSLAYPGPDGVKADTMAWLAQVAIKLLAANKVKDADQRRDRIVQAVGLLGVVPFEPEAIRQLSAFIDGYIVGGSAKAKATRQTELRRLVRLACTIPPSTNDAAVDARISRALIRDD
jgi:hypothetical protein